MTTVKELVACGLSTKSIENLRILATDRERSSGGTKSVTHDYRLPETIWKTPGPELT